MKTQRPTTLASRSRRRLLPHLLASLAAIFVVPIGVAGIARAELPAGSSEALTPEDAGPPTFATPPPEPALVVNRPRVRQPSPWAGSPWQPTVGFNVGGTTGAGRSLLGVELGLGAVFHDRFLLELRLGGLGDISRKPNPSPYLEKSEGRALLGFETGLRLHLNRGAGMRVNLVPRLGIHAGVDLHRAKLGTVGPAGQVIITEENSTRWSALPTAGVALELGYLELAYRYYLDAGDHRRSVHGISGGFRF